MPDDELEKETEPAAPVTGALVNEPPAEVTGGPELPRKGGSASHAAGPRKRKAKPKEPKYVPPTQVKPHKPQHEPKSKLPKDYRHPVGAQKGGETLPPSKFGAAREKEVAAAQPEAIAEKANLEARKPGKKKKK